jgi:hypothetical protein
VNTGNKYVTIMAFFVIAMILCFTSSCTGIEQTTGVAKNGVSAAASQINPSNNSSLPPESPLIPYGEYVASAAGYTSSITLNTDGTYSTEDLFTGKTGGTYTVSPDYITLYYPAAHVATKQKYTYSDKLKCLYLYTADSESPMPFYKR